MESSPLLSFLFALTLLAAVASARPGLHFLPCKTLFISYTFSSSETNNPSFSSGEYFTIYHNFRPLPITFHRPHAADVTDLVRSEPSFGLSSLHDRAKDILVVVAGLLFGVGCGALTGGIMYLAWSLYTNQYEICRSGRYEDEEEQATPKKMGYVMIADPVPAKEGYEGN